MSSLDGPLLSPDDTPVMGIARVGLVHIDDSVTTLQAVRRAMYADGVLVESFTSIAAYGERPPSRVRAALLDVDLGDDTNGEQAAELIRKAHPTARLAFFTAELTPERRAQLAPYGPVFAKQSDLEAVVAWLRAAVAPPR